MLKMEFIGLKTHRFVGTSCHLTLNFSTASGRYLSLTLCAQNLVPSEWLSLSLNSTTYYIGKQNQSIQINLGVETPLYETDSILVSVPADLMASRLSVKQTIRLYWHRQT